MKAFSSHRSLNKSILRSSRIMGGVCSNQVPTGVSMAASPSSAPSTHPVVESTATVAAQPLSKPALPPAPVLSPMNVLNVPISVMTDSYKATHYQQYPDATKMVAVSGGTQRVT